MKKDKSIEETIKDEALSKYPVCMVQGEGGYGHEVDENQWEREAYIAGRSQNLAREKELEVGLRMLLKPENREHMISIASATLNGELAKQLLNP